MNLKLHQRSTSKDPKRGRGSPFAERFDPKTSDILRSICWSGGCLYWHYWTFPFVQKYEQLFSTNFHSASFYASSRHTITILVSNLTSNATRTTIWASSLDLYNLGSLRLERRSEECFMQPHDWLRFSGTWLYNNEMVSPGNPGVWNFLDSCLLNH